MNVNKNTPGHNTNSHEDDLDTLSQNLRAILLNSSQLGASSSGNHHVNVPDSSVLLEHQKELLDEASSEEDFRCKDLTPQEQSPENPKNKKDDLSSEDDFRCEDTTPQKVSPEKNNSLDEALLMEQQKEILQWDGSSGDEDFCCAVRTPTPPATPESNESASFDVVNHAGTGEWPDEVQNEALHFIEEPSSTRHSGAKEPVSLSSSIDSFRTTHSQESNLVLDNKPPFIYKETLASKTESKIVSNGDEEPSTVSTENELDDSSSDNDHPDPDEMLTPTIVQSDISCGGEKKQTSESEEKEIQELLNKVLSPTTISKIGPPCANEPFASKDPVKKYNRSQLFNIRKSRTADEWMAYLSVNHGKECKLGEMPFQLDPELRCPYPIQLRVLREREAKARRDAMYRHGRTAEDSPNRRGHFEKNSQQFYANGPVQKMAVKQGNQVENIPKKKKNKKKKKDGSFGAVQRPVVCAPTSSNDPMKNNLANVEPALIQFDGPSPSEFNDRQVAVWMKYLECINSRINQLLVGDKMTECQ